MSDKKDKQCCKTVWGERTTHWSCQRTAKYTYNGKRYCYIHYPPNVEKRNRAAAEKYRAKLDKDSAKYNRQRDCLAACSGVTFITDDPTGIVARLALQLKEMTDLYSSVLNSRYDDSASASARALLAQVRIEADEDETIPPCVDLVAKIQPEPTKNEIWRGLELEQRAITILNQGERGGG